MTVDERLEALIHSVELLAGMQHDSEQRFAQVASSINTLIDHTERFHRVMRAAFEAYYKNGESHEE